jgi:PEP-CTERM motif
MSMKALFVAGVLTASAVALIATSASAATVINAVSPVILDASIPADSIGTIDGVDVNASNTYDWTFAIDGGPVGALSQMQAAIVVQQSAVPEPIEFSLYSGAPGSGTLVDTSSDTVGSALFDVPLSAGNYFIQLDPSNIAVNGEEVSGSIQVFSGVSAAPEPATWAMMVLGVGVIGAAMRFSRRSATGSAVA